MTSGTAMAKGRKSKRANRSPDDYFAAGPFEFARFGKLVVGRSRASSRQFEAVQARMADELPKIVAEIDTLVANIAKRVARLPPERLLHRGWWELAATAIRLDDKDVDESDQIAAMRMIDYVQSVIASVEPSTSSLENVSEEDWAALKTDVASLFTRLTLEYQMCLTASLRAQDPNVDMELEEFRFRAEILWMNVRGARYQPLESKALLDVLTPHSDVLSRLFGIDAPTLVGELDKILMKLTLGIPEVLGEMTQLRKEALGRLTQLAGDSSVADIDGLRRKILEDPDLMARRDKVVGGMLGFDLFDVEKITHLPKPLLDELAWSPGEDDEFFAPGEFRGWPQRVWPTMKRPFIKLGGRVLCFDKFALFDNLYRVLQRVILRLEPNYKQTWNDRQKAVSEELPLTYLNRILPGARVFRQVYYRWQVGDGAAQWCEADGLLMFDDHLFVIEVKAGAFTYTSPATDLPAHIASLRNLVLGPASQASRFIDYLESAPEISIADANHREVGRLHRSDFRHITACAITLDQFTALAARAQHLRKVGVDVGARSVWALSIDDLRVYADLFDNPLVFLHFVEQRMRAAHSELVDLNDEIDHLGLYVCENNYSQYAAKIVGEQMARLNLTGYSTPIDKYYDAIVRGQPATPPRQSMPQRITEIVGFLANSEMTGRSELASFLLDGGGDTRAKLAAAIDQQLRDNVELRRARPLSTYGDMRLTLFSGPPAAPRQAASAVEHTRVVMLGSGENSRPLVELEYAGEGVLKAVHWQHLDVAGLSSAELDRLRAEGAALRQRRVLAVRRQRKIGPNELCPCGSGRKYKRCCRP